MEYEWIFLASLSKGCMRQSNQNDLHVKFYFMLRTFHQRNDWCCNNRAYNRVHCGPLSYSFVCTYTTSLLSLCTLIWKYWISKWLVDYILSSVGLFFKLSFMRYMGLCIWLNDCYFDDWENMYTLFFYNHHFGNKNNWPLFMSKSGNSGMPCMSFVFLCSFFAINFQSLLYHFNILGEG